MKKTRMTSPATILSTRLICGPEPRSRLSKKEGTVIELCATSV